jgi:signal transduction histidine kinase/CheY-like chemotaxis protein
MSRRQPTDELRLLESKLAALEELLAVQERTVAQQSETLIRARTDAMAATRAKSEFLASMSHELRTPLNSVIGFSQLLVKNKVGNLTSHQLDYLERILRNGKHLLALIDSILDLSKIEAGRAEVHRAAVDIGELVRETVRQLQGQICDKDVELVAEVPADALPIDTDRSKLQQIIINLAGNAIKFTERGRVTVRVGLARGTCHPTRIEVVDTGIGVPEAELERVFESFAQVDASTARQFGGTGLGLAITRSLCDLLGYRIEVESTVGRGSTFRIVLGEAPSDGPAERAPTPAARTARDRGGPLLREMTVLVVDDDADSRLLLTQHLEELGGKVITVGTGDEALRLARVRRPDLITLDLVMPDMDGWQTLRMLKADPDLQGIPVVVVSIASGEQNGSLLGAVDLLTKPVSRRELSRVLARVVHGKAAKALVVEDDADTRHLLRSYLEEEGLEVRMAGNGKQALDVMESFLPDLITLDLLMSEMDGLVFLDHLRKDERYLRVPVIVVTGYELSPDERRRLSDQARAILRKGDGIANELKAVVRSLIAT